ncbi:FadR/GntR family transcriptional regulator [Rhodococcus sp. NPDC003382]|uniref:FadR/GntR family transcriptional regulator n=1 Tax=Rhodococcus sp. HM1 TaxID=2937759 RepID=UPI00200A539C|nr:GntR family transcriptional regulator [Rhodococcus sp. HM1]MCK8669766.1 GntR family transcriptional regulator [Rhodococcus sp. HM1]
MSTRAFSSLGAMSGSVRIPKTAELVAARLRREIVRGELATGDMLPPEATLMEDFGVSRATLREAFRLLEAESLIQRKRGGHGGAVVSRPDISVAARSVGLILQMNGTTLEEIYAARIVFEPVCARLFAERRTDEDVAELRSCLASMRAVTEKDLSTSRGPRHWADLTIRFQSTITDRCGNKALSVQAGVLRDIVATHQATAIAQGNHLPGVWRHFLRNIRSYEKLVDLLEADDGAGAEAHWAAHLTAVRKLVLGNDAGRTAVVDMFE